jgi:hypothetical protein
MHHAFAGQLNCFAQLNALLELHDRGNSVIITSIKIITSIIINHAFASQLNCFMQLRALLVLHDRGKDPSSTFP